MLTLALTVFIVLFCIANAEAVVKLTLLALFYACLIGLPLALLALTLAILTH